MYSIQCHAGFSMPLGKTVEKGEIYGFNATVNDPAAASQFAIIDDDTLTESSSLGRLLTSVELSDAKVIIANIKGIASVDSILSDQFAEPIKIRKGISVYAINLKGGSVCLYRR